MLRIVLLIQILIINQAHALWFSGPDPDDYLMEQNEEYSFQSCKQYQPKEEPENEVEYVLKCEQSQLESHPIQDEDQVSNLLKSVQLMQKDEFEKMMMLDFKKFVMDKLETNYSNLEKDNICFSENAPANCRDKVESLTSLVKSQYPRMRQNLSLKESIGFRINTNHDLNDPNLLSAVERKIDHPYHPTEIPQLSDEEARTAVKTFWEQRGEYLENNHSNNSCVKFDENIMHTRFNRSTRYCGQRFASQVGARFSKDFKENREQDYSEQVSSMPFLPYMTLGDISNTSDQVIQANIKQAYGKIMSEAGNKIQEMKRWPLNDFKDLFRYQGLIEEYLKEKNPPPRFLCDVVENVHDWHGDGGWWSLAGDLGLGAAALIGGGVCFFTAGLGCAVGVGIVSVAADAGKQQLNVNQTYEDYHSGIALTTDIEEAETDRAFALAFAPLSFIGLQAGKGFKPAVQAITNSARRVKADAAKISRFLANIGSKGKRNLIKAKEIFGHTDVATVIAMTSQLPAEMQLLMKQVFSDPDMVNSQAFTTLLQDARGLMTAQCLEKGNL